MTLEQLWVKAIMADRAFRECPSDWIGRGDNWSDPKSAELKRLIRTRDITAETFRIAREEGIDAAVMWKLANG